MTHPSNPSLESAIPFDSTDAGSTFDAVVDHVRNLAGGVLREEPGWLLQVFLELRGEPHFAAALAPVELGRVSARTSARVFTTRFDAAVGEGRLVVERARRPAGEFGANFEVLTGIFGLSDVEADVLQFVVLQRIRPVLERITNLTHMQGKSAALRLLASAIARPESEVVAALAPEGRLAGSGVVEVAVEGMWFEQHVALAPWVVDALRQPNLDRAGLLGHLLPEAPRPTVGVADLGHLTAEFDAAARILRQALADRVPGVNVLLYGPAGTGKTEFAKVLAEHLGAPLHLAGAVESEERPGTGGDRVASMRLAHRLLGGGGALLLLDEAEDLFPTHPFGLPMPARVGTKQGITLLLEQNPVPTVWITNDIDGMDEAIRRRFGYAVKFEAPGFALRRSIWGRHAAGTGLSSGDLDALALRFEVGPAQIATATRSAGLLAGGPPDRAAIERVLVPLVALFDGESPTPPEGDEPTYDCRAVNAATDIGALLDRLSGWRPDGRPGLTVLLHGPPGTGKSAFVHALARRMGRRVMARSGSDLTSMWVGQTEKQIAAAFAEAEQEEVVLLLDEVDSLISDRRHHVRNYESSQTNEFLQRLERFRGVVACTTNLLSDVDPAALRRFIVKVGFDHLGPDQALAAFDALFGSLVEVPADPAWRAALRIDLGRIGQLAPGDFQAVARRMRVLGAGRVPVGELVGELRSEVAVKQGVRRSAGFGA